MKRWLFNVAAALSLLLSLWAIASWVASYVQPREWRLLGMVHSADLRVVAPVRGAVLSMVSDGSAASLHGYWDAWWARSEAGGLWMVAHFADYAGRIRGLHASPPSAVVELPARSGARAVAFARVPDSPAWAQWLGFAWSHDAPQAVVDRTGDGAYAGIRGQMVRLPWWAIVLASLPLPIVWLRARREKVPPPG